MQIATHCHVTKVSVSGMPVRLKWRRTLRVRIVAIDQFANERRLPPITLLSLGALAGK